MQSLLTPAIIDTLTESFTAVKKIQHLRGDPSHPLATTQCLSLDEFQQLHLPTQHHPQLSSITLHTLPAEVASEATDNVAVARTQQRYRSLADQMKAAQSVMATSELTLWSDSQYF